MLTDERPDWHHTAPCRGRTSIYYPSKGFDAVAYALGRPHLSSLPVHHRVPGRR